MNSTISSRVAGRHIRRLGRALYWRLPATWRDQVVEFSYKHVGRLFRGMAHYELWKQRRGGAAVTHTTGLAAGLTDISQVVPLGAVDGRIAVHVHLFYPELAAEFASALGNMPFHYDLYVSVQNEKAEAISRQAFDRLPRLGRLTIAQTPNRGRDMAPMVCHFGSALAGYDYIAHFHSKKSLYNKGTTQGWREYLLQGLLGSEERVRKIFRLMADGAGMVYPQTFADLPYMAGTWLANRAAGAAWGARLGIERLPQGYFDFPVGSMFWARVDTIRPLLTSGIREDDFEPEQGQTDGTLAHALERLLGVLVRDGGRPIAILRDEHRPSWSPWRFDQHTGRSLEWACAVIASPDHDLVVFDVFDTLLVRPLLEPERLKEIVARRAGGALGPVYLRCRAEAERTARARAGHDVGLADVMAELGRTEGLAASDVERLLDLELEVERGAVSVRPGMDDLLRHALSVGKRVVLASDMYLPRDVVEAMLRANGLDGWSRAFVSSELGLRKDSGELYRHILDVEGVSANSVLVVGDNERSDFQIPVDMGMRTLHLPRPLELARSTHRMSRMIAEFERGGSLEDDIGLGLIVRGTFSQAFFGERFDPDGLMPLPDARMQGYAIAGPLVVAFAHWLLRNAQADGVRHLYFLAREGQFLKEIYDQVVADLADAPVGHYLVISRRAANVPSISSLDDVFAIAEAYFGPAPLEKFLLERFGLELDQTSSSDLYRSGVWKQGRPVTVRDEGIEALKPMLEALFPRIQEQAAIERVGMHAYLEQQGLVGDGMCAVVDVGYSGTIQRRLNAMLGGGVHGYYMATDVRSAALEVEFGAHARGCYHHRAPIGEQSPLFVRLSFLVEKLLSSDDPQVVRYWLDSGMAVPEFRVLTAEERATSSVRADVRNGARAFASEVVHIRSELLPGFDFPIAMARSLFEHFVERLSPAEEAVLKQLVLDDHYCGRGLIA